MRVNKEQLERLAAMPDEQLWREIVSIAERYGIKMPTATPPHNELERLRATVSGAKLNVGEAMRILQGYKGGGK